jgi:hypothetical protein
MTASAHIEHQTPHRLRLRVPTMKRTGEFFSDLETKLRANKVIKAIETNARTGSILIFHDDDFEEVKKTLHDFLKIEPRKKKSKPHPWPDSVFAQINKADRAIKNGSSHQLDLSIVVATGILGLATLQVFRKEVLPPAWTLLGDAFLILAKRQKSNAQQAGQLVRHEV